MSKGESFTVEWLGPWNCLWAFGCMDGWTDGLHAHGVGTIWQALSDTEFDITGSHRNGI